MQQPEAATRDRITNISTAEAGPALTQILIGDGDQAFWEALQPRFTQQHYAITLAADGPALLRAASRQRPDLILVDLSLLEQTEFDLLRTLEDDPQTAGIAVLLLTSLADHDAAIVCRTLGTTDYLTRPFSTRELLTRIDAACTLSRLRRESQMALHKSESLYRALAANLPHGAAFVIDHSMRYLLAEGQAMLTAGMQSADLEGKTIYEALPAHLAEAYAPHYQQALAGQPFHTEHNAHGRRYVTHGVPLYDDNGMIYAALAVSYDITERLTFEAALRNTAEVEAFRATLNDTLRPLGDPRDIQQAAAELLGRHLQAGRVNYFEVDESDPSGRYAIITSNYTHDMEPLRMRCRLEDFGPLLMREFLAGKTLVMADVANDERLTAQEKAAHQVFASAAYVVVPLMKDGKNRTNLVVEHRTRHDWSGEEIRLIEEIAERTWAAVERARAEAALQAAHAAMERRVRERTAALAQSNQALQAEIAGRRKAEQMRQELLRELMAAQEDERLRIARDLHDMLGQQITGLLLGFKRLEAHVGPAESAELIEPLRALALDMGKETYRMAMNLRPTALDDVGLMPALERLVAEWSAQSEIAGEVADFSNEDIRLAPEIETALYRIVQEALTNVRKHASAQQVSLIVERRAEQVLVIIEDDGSGYDADSLLEADTRPRLGVLGMRERVAQLGGTIEIESSPGIGTTIFIRIPLLLSQ